jgi:5-methylcytosine-specific restriction protein B
MNLGTDVETTAVTSSAQTWFVGAVFDDRSENQIERFLADGVWENGYEHKYIDLVRSMRKGDRIAIKSSYIRRRGLPFDSRGQAVSVMAIKAVGTVSENVGDGRVVHVEWTRVDPVREWYFYTNRQAVWRVLSGDWKADGLITFSFDGASQDIERFCNAPFWAERFGTQPATQRRFAWTKFYEAVADKLLAYRNDRAPLVAALREISSRRDGLGYLADDHYTDGTSGFVRDICPFTTLGLFNRGIKLAGRKALAQELAEFLGVDENVPETFEGIPILNNLKSWYFPYEDDREPDHIDALWSVFAAGLKIADPEEEVKSEFARTFDAANGRMGVAWNLTIGLYWIRPWSFPSLDNNSQTYITQKLGVPIGHNGAKRRCSSGDYLAVIDALEPRFEEASYPVHSFPELSLEAWKFKPAVSINDEGDSNRDAEVVNDGSGQEAEKFETVRNPAPMVAYVIDDIIKDGCFLPRLRIEEILDELRGKKNVILQGPPGTGKTWLAKRLAFALIGERDDSKVRAVQFHPNLSYEDFVRGWRPTGEGKLSIADGVFMEAVRAASEDPKSKFVVVIEEINRGNPAQIFGEMLTLLEASKRTPSEALELCYPDKEGRRIPVHVPENLYVIGTMNIADRSLAVVDFALRRRFGFVTLDPSLGAEWRGWVTDERSVDRGLVGDIERRVNELNGQIGSDSRLGKKFRIGHSFVTPAYRLEADETRKWFKRVVETEIGPLLEEYWFDTPEEARKASERLLEGW